MSFRGSSAILVNNSVDPPNGRTMAAAIAAAKPNAGFLPDDMGTKQAKVIMDYDAILPQEISVKLNDILIVYRLPGMDSEYVMAEKDGHRGKVPVTYLELL